MRMIIGRFVHIAQLLEDIAGRPPTWIVGLSDENSRGKVQNVRGVVMSGAHPVA
jgi:hypothetical protein